MIRRGTPSARRTRRASTADTSGRAWGYSERAGAACGGKARCRPVGKSHATSTTRPSSTSAEPLVAAHPTTVESCVESGKRMSARTGRRTCSKQAEIPAWMLVLAAKVLVEDCRCLRTFATRLGPRADAGRCPAHGVVNAADRWPVAEAAAARGRPHPRRSGHVLRSQTDTRSSSAAVVRSASAPATAHSG